MGMISDNYRRAIETMREQANGDMQIVDRAWSEAMKTAAKQGKTAPELQDVVKLIKKIQNGGRV